MGFYTMSPYPSVIDDYDLDISRLKFLQLGLCMLIFHCPTEEEMEFTSRFSLCKSISLRVYEIVKFIVVRISMFVEPIDSHIARKRR